MVNSNKEVVNQRVFTKSLLDKKLVYIADTETDGLYQDLTKIHCLVLRNFNTGEMFKYGPDKVEEGLERLATAEVIVGQNIIDFDMRAIKKVYPNWTHKAKIIDTLVLSRLIYSNLAMLDVITLSRNPALKETFKVWDRTKKKEVSAVGRHSLEAWGLRIGREKDKFGRDTDWKEYSPEMLEYCAIDVEVTDELFKRQLARNYPMEPVALEHKIQNIITPQIERGWEFDVEAAHDLRAKLLQRMHEITHTLQDVFPGWDEPMKQVESYSYTHKPSGKGFSKPGKKELEDFAYHTLKELGWKKLTRKEIKEGIIDGPVRKRHIAFNPSSRAHIHRAFSEKYNWKPKYWLDDGTAKVDEAVLKTLKFPEATTLLEYELVSDRLEKLEGKEEDKETGLSGWIGAERNGRVHGYVNPLGTQTSRGTHSNPNLGQVPAVYSPYGEECRRLFKAKPGYVLVGTDASGQELRCLSHFMYPFDKGAYAKVVVSGDKDKGTDVHSVNMRAARLPDRDTAKTFIYGWLYGAGDAKIGKIISKGAKEGRQLKEQFLKALPALAKLKQMVEHQAETKRFIWSIDGRKIFIRSSHSALNFLLQSTGAILTKRWMLFIDEEIEARGWRGLANQVAWIHDELQFEVREDIAPEFAEVCKSAMKKVEEFYDFKCPLDAEAKIGKNWCETH